MLSHMLFPPFTWSDMILRTISSSSLLSMASYWFNTAAENGILYNIKEKHCYVAFDFEKEQQIAKLSPSTEMEYELSDGQLLTIGDECFQCPEALFN